MTSTETIKNEVQKPQKEQQKQHWTDKAKGVVLLVFCGVCLNPAKPDYVYAAICGVLGLAILW